MLKVRGPHCGPESLTWQGFQAIVIKQCNELLTTPAFWELTTVNEHEHLAIAKLYLGKWTEIASNYVADFR